MKDEPALHEYVQNQGEQCASRLGRRSEKEAELLIYMVIV
mgnify:CR=1 FL=1